VLTQIDRYVVNRFTRVLIVSLISFIAIYIVVDLIDHLDDFLRDALGFTSIARYYVNYIPYIVVLTLPIGMLLSTLFVIGEMGSSNELVALKAAGISIYRIAWPLLRVAFLVSIISMLLAELIVPGANEARRDILDIRGSRTAQQHSRHITRQDRGGYVLYASYYNHEHQRASNVTIVQIAGNTTRRRIDASEMVWDNEGWLLTNAVDRVLVEGSESLDEYVTMRLPVLTLRPTDLAREDKDPEQMAFLELRDFIARIREAGGDGSRWLVDLHLKIAVPLASFMMVWLGFPLAARSWRGGKAVYVGWTLLIGFMFFVVVRAGQAMGRAGSIQPEIGAWAADALFFVVGATLFRWTRK